MKLLLKGGILTDPANNIIEEELDILVEDGKIICVDKNIVAESATLIDVSGKIVSPGFVDMHVHLREPGREDKETIASATRAAARGGITSIVGMTNTDPVADSPTVLEYVYSRAQKEGVINVFPAANITQGAEGKQIAEIGQLKKYGAVALTDDGSPVTNLNIMRRALEYASMFDLPLLSHSQDLDLTDEGVIHEGEVSTELGMPGQPEAAEVVAILREIALAQMTNHHIHFCHVSTRKSVEFIQDAKRRGVPITAETCPHYFTLTHHDVKKYFANAIMQPPLRPEEDRQAMIEYLQNDTIDVISTDHAPHLLGDKYLELAEVARGIVGLETSIPLVMTHLVHKGKLTIKQMVEKMSVNPARIVRIDKGHLSVGADADITIIDPERREIIDKDKFCSKGRNTPFHGWEVKGVPIMTIVNGKIVMRDREIIV